MWLKTWYQMRFLACTALVTDVHSDHQSGALALLKSVSEPLFKALCEISVEKNWLEIYGYFLLTLGCFFLSTPVHPTKRNPVP